MKFALITLLVFSSCISFARAEDAVLKNEDFENICKGAISIEFSKPMKEIKLRKKSPRYSKEDPIVRVYYIRNNDGTAWNYDCKFSGNRVYWRSADNNNGAPGRWRDMPVDKFGNTADAILSFDVEKNKIIVVSDQSDDKAEFPKRP